MGSPFSSSNPLGYTGIDYYTEPPFINANRAPTINDIYFPGTRWQNSSVNPAVIYQTNGSGIWSIDTNNDATTTSSGLVKLSTLAQLEGGTAPSGAYVPKANDVF